MSKLLVVVFPNEAKAQAGSDALEALHTEGNLTLYAAAILTKADDGSTSVRRMKEPGPRGAGLAALIGGVVGLLGGPATATFGAAAGAVSGGWLDAVRLGARADFLADITGALTPGKSALLAEVAEDRMSPLDLRMEALGGKVFRERRPDFEEDEVEKQVTSSMAALAQLEAQHDSVEEEIRARLRERIAEMQATLARSTDRASARIEQLEEETKAKIASLKDQAAQASPEVKARIERRIAELRSEYHRRAGKLRQALAVAKEAFD